MGKRNRYSNRLDNLLAQSERKKDRINPNRKMRGCLGGCKQMFMSEHSGHRICPSCTPGVERSAGMFSEHFDSGKQK